MPKRETATDFLNRLMEFSPAGPLTQAFIMQAIDCYAQAVIQCEHVDDTTLISGESWKQVAQLVRHEMDRHMGRKEAGNDIH